MKSEYTEIETLLSGCSDYDLKMNQGIFKTAHNSGCSDYDFKMNQGIFKTVHKFIPLSDTL